MAKGHLHFYIDKQSVRSLQRIEKLFDAFGEEITPAVARALNRAVKGVGKDASKAIQEKYILKAARIKKAIRKPRFATRSNLESIFYMRGNPISLFNFKARPNVPTTHTTDTVSTRAHQPVSTRVAKGGGGKLSDDFFIARMQSGHMGVFGRRSSGELYQLYGPSAPQLLEAAVEDSDEIISSGFEERLMKRLNHEVDYLLKTKG